MHGVGSDYWSKAAEDAFPLTPFYAEMAEIYGWVTKDASPEQRLLAAQRVAACLLYDAAQVFVNVGDVKKPHKIALDYLPGAPLHGAYAGPRNRARVMVIGKNPDPADIATKKNMAGAAGELMREIADNVGLDIIDWYYTNIVRWLVPKGLNIKGWHIKDCMPLLAQEIAMLQPEYILVMGADAVKAVFNKSSTLQKVRSLTFLLPSVNALGAEMQNVETDPAGIDEFTYKSNIKVFSTIHPSAVLREEGWREGLVSDLVKFRDMLRFDSPVTVVHNASDRDYRVLTTVEEVEAIYYEILKGGFKMVSVDCEWGGGNFKRGVLRTIQLSWKVKQAVCIVLTHQGGVPAMPIADRAKVMYILRMIVLIESMVVTGHHLRADAKWLEEEGIPVMERMGFDTMLADHALNENAEHGLDSLSVRNTDMGRYDFPLNGVLKQLKITGKVVKRDGYLNVPTDAITFYGMCDTDCTLRNTDVLLGRLMDPRNAGPANCFFNVSLPCMRPIHEIETVGMPVDRERMELMVHEFEEKKNELVDKLRMEIQQPQFNPRSTDQVKKLLFGPKEEGGFELVPYKTTEKPSRMWEDILKLPEHKRVNINPSTDAESLEAMSQSGVKAVKMLRDFKLIDQVAKSFLRLPDEDAFGHTEYTSGLVGAIDPDGRIRTSIQQTSETGRHKSSDPNLQNLPSKQNKLLQKIIGEQAYNTIRSCFIAPRETVKKFNILKNVMEDIGYVIIDADFKSAELLVLGYLAGCEKLVKDVPGDLHARGAVTSLGAEPWDGFDQRLPPPDWWLDKYKHLRIGRKTVNFGIPYQRGAAAIARQVLKDTEGKIQCDKAQAQAMIDGFYNDYPEVRAFVDNCKRSVTDPGYLDNPYGRRRRATPFHGDESALAAQQREFVNFPIQGTVADAENTALINLYNWRIQNPGMADYKIALAIHDANMLLVRADCVGMVVERVLPESMNTNCVIPSWNFFPGVAPTKPFSLDIDIGVSLRWGEKPKLQELLAVGVEEKWANKFAKRDKKGNIVV